MYRNYTSLAKISLATITPLHLQKTIKSIKATGFPGGAVVESPPANAGDTGWMPGPGRSHMLRSN